MESLHKQLHTLGTPRLVRKGSTILFQGEIPRTVSVIRDGIVREYTIDSNGDERIVALYSKGDVFPLSWTLGKTSNTLFYYDALVDTRMICVSKQQFLDIVMTNRVILAELLQFISNEYTALLLRATGLEQSRAVEKIAYTLYYLLFRYGTQTSANEYTISIKMSQAMIASFVGITRESTAKNLKILKDKKIITYSHSIYTINKTKLEAFMGEDGFRDMVVN